MFEKLPSKQLLEIQLPWNVAIELMDDDAEVYRVLSALDHPQAATSSENEAFTCWTLPARKVAHTLLEDRFDERFLLTAKELMKHIAEVGDTQVEVTVLKQAASNLFQSDFEDESIQSSTDDIEFSINMSWRLAAILVPSRADHLKTQLAKAASEKPNSSQCLALWSFRTDWLIEALAQEHFTGRFAATIEHLTRRLVFDGQVITKVYVTSNEPKYPLGLPTADYPLQVASEVSQ
jgi:hypothetical protein